MVERQVDVDDELITRQRPVAAVAAPDRLVGTADRDVELRFGVRRSIGRWPLPPFDAAVTAEAGHHLLTACTRRLDHRALVDVGATHDRIDRSRAVSAGPAAANA